MNYDADDEEIDTFLDARDFQKKVLKYPGVAVVEFFASWCPPCSQFQLIKQQTLPIRKNRFHYNWFKIDIDKNLEFSKGYELEGAPTVILYYQGQVIDKYVGLDLKGYERIKDQAEKLQQSYVSFLQ